MILSRLLRGRAAFLAGPVSIFSNAILCHVVSGASFLPKNEPSRTSGQDDNMRVFCVYGTVSIGTHGANATSRVSRSGHIIKDSGICYMIFLEVRGQRYFFSGRKTSLLRNLHFKRMAEGVRDSYSSVH